MSAGIVCFWLVVMLALLAVNAVFVAIEFALVALRPTRVQELIDEGSTSAQVVQRLQKHIDTSVSGAQLGITIASLALGWVCEPALHQLINGIIGLIPGVNGLHIPHGISLVLSLMLMSVLHVVLGEQLPKCLSLRKAEQTALWLACPFAIYCRFAYPLIWGLERLTERGLRLIGIPKAHENETSVPSAEELEILFEHSLRAGEIDERESEMLKGVFDLDELTAAQVMVPRAQMECVDRRASLRETLAIATRTKHNKLPVFDATSNRIVGVLYVQDVLELLDAHAQVVAGSMTIVIQPTSLDRLMKPVVSVPQDIKANDLLEQMRSQNVQLAIVTDAAGKPVGMLTMEDVIEELVGEINDEPVPVTSA